MKYFTKNVVIIAMLLLFAVGCGVVEKDGSERDLQEILNQDELIVLTGFNAYSYFIYRGETMGFDYELISRFAEELGVRLVIRIVPELEEMFRMLNEGEGDIIAYNLTVTNDRKERIAFTDYLYTTKQVLVQRKPENWRTKKRHEIEAQLIKTPLELDGKTINVRGHSVYRKRLENLADEIGGTINVVEAEGDVSVEHLIEMVSDGVIDYTIADENVAQLSKAQYENIDISMEVSLSQMISWGVRRNSTELRAALNTWIDSLKSEAVYYTIYNKYFDDRSRYRRRMESEYLVNIGGKLSQYDEELKAYAGELGWNWLLLASVIYQESQFDPYAQSWAGARGLMQLMPGTAKDMGVSNVYNPEQNMKGGVKYLKFLQSYWEDKIDDEQERIKFILASYNAGYGHVIDARALAEKFGADPDVWDDNVEKYLLLKSQKKYYTDDVVKYGYCRGFEPVNYVRDILYRFHQYEELYHVTKSINKVLIF